jgi:CBS-domain-containing membrane protein
MGRLRQLVRHQRGLGRAYQPRFHPSQIALSWLGGLVAITALGLISGAAHAPLLVAPFGASTVLLFGHPKSPLAQPRNVILGNSLAALVSVACVAWLGPAPWVMGLAVGTAIALGQLARCLHPPAGAVALLGVLLHAQPSFVLVPVLSGSLLLVLLAVLFHRFRGPAAAYPHHWV